MSSMEVIYIPWSKAVTGLKCFVYSCILLRVMVYVESL
jgi:hypothetical protein